MILLYILAGLCGGVLTGMAGLTAAMVVTPMLCGVCGWAGYDATTLSLTANISAALVTCHTYYKNGNVDFKRTKRVVGSAFIGAECFHRHRPDRGQRAVAAAGCLRKEERLEFIKKIPGLNVSSLVFFLGWMKGLEPSIFRATI